MSEASHPLEGLIDVAAARRDVKLEAVPPSADESAAFVRGEILRAARDFKTLAARQMTEVGSPFSFPQEIPDLTGLELPAGVRVVKQDDHTVLVSAVPGDTI